MYSGKIAVPPSGGGTVQDITFLMRLGYIFFLVSFISQNYKIWSASNFHKLK
jgi:hypothetical protein